MKVFSKEKFIEAEGRFTNKNEQEWVEECDGKEVIDNSVETHNRMVRYIVIDEWCVEVE